MNKLFLIPILAMLATGLAMATSAPTQAQQISNADLRISCATQTLDNFASAINGNTVVLGLTGTLDTSAVDSASATFLTDSASVLSGSIQFKQLVTDLKNYIGAVTDFAQSAETLLADVTWGSHNVPGQKAIFGTPWLSYVACVSPPS